MVPDTSVRASGQVLWFLIAFFAGTAAIVLLRITLSDPNWVGVVCAALAASVAIALLGVHYCHSNSPEALDRAGDNLYYLGFLFTLVSLIYALVDLFLFEDRNTALTLANRTYILIGSFGIALLSTVAGILGRIILHDRSEGRKVPDESPGYPPPRGETRSSEGSIGKGTSRDGIEDWNMPDEAIESRYYRDDAVPGRPDIGLHLFIRRLRAEIRNATDAFSHYNRMTMLQAQDTKRHAKRMAQEFTRKLEKDAQDSVTRTGDAYRNLVDQANATVMPFESRVGEAVGAVATVLEQLSSASHALSELPANVKQVRRSMEVLGEAANTATTRLDKEAEEIRKAGEILVLTAREQRTIMAQSGEFAGTVATLIEQLEAASRSFAEIPGNMEQTRTDVNSINESMNAVVGGLEKKIGEVARASDSLARSAHEQRLIMERSVGINSAFTSLAGQLESANQSLAALPTNIERVQQTMDAFGKATDDSKGSIHIKAGEVIGTFETLTRSVHEQQQLMERILEAARTMNTRVDSEGSEWRRNFEELRIAFKIIPQAADALAALVKQLESATRSLAEFSEIMKRTERIRSAAGASTTTLADESVVVPSRQSGRRTPWFGKKK